MNDFSIPTAAVVPVTPHMAREWLTLNQSNRRMRPAIVERYARDMAAGHWSLNGEAVKFSSTGRLLDGQHRLSAVVASGATVSMLVVKGLADAAQATMDAGAKRTAGDVLGLRGHKSSLLLASVLKKVWSWEQGDHRFVNKLTPTTTELLDLLEERPEIQRSVEIAEQIRSGLRPLPPTVTGLSHHLLSRIDLGQATWFFARVGDGAELPLGHPILTLRTRIISESQSQVRYPAHVRLAYVIRTWNAVREERDLLKIVQAIKDPMPMPR